mmetsp:Transcript_41509/g.133990  ORF Transcript_41509/g.133990 Transcript_41509/m.133990 type:complete len:774 (-) Transcript_41509:166-2487(-)
MPRELDGNRMAFATEMLPAEGGHPSSNSEQAADGGPRRQRMVLGTWGLALVYVLVCFIVALVMYQHVGPSGGLGQAAMQSASAIAGNGKRRGYDTEQDKWVVQYLKSRISELELQFPGRIQTSHQNVKLSNDTRFGAFGREECMAIATDACVRAWGKSGGFRSTECAKDCPFDLAQPQGPRCCGLLAPAGAGSGRSSDQPWLPAFWSEVAKEHAADDDISNIVFLVRGSGESTSGSALLASAHHDSVGWSGGRLADDPSEHSNQGPGVIDDLAAVAVLLEVARTLASSEPLPRDVIFIFNDGEEVGCRGSTLFKQFHPWKHRPAFVINLEGKGKASSTEWLVRSNSAYAANAYARFATSPGGFSFGEWAFKNLNIGYTDLSVYSRLGYHGFDLVYVHDAYVYHTPDDNVNTASPEGLQHEGSNVLSIIRGVAQDSDFPTLKTKDEDPTVGLWNNELSSDPSMDSNSVYVGMYGSSLWIMSMTAAQVLFGLVAVMAVVVSGGSVWFLVKTAVPVSSLPAAIAADFGISFLSLLSGFTAAVASGMFVGVRDLRTWYDWQLLRLLFTTLTSGMPLLMLERLRRSQCCSCSRARGISETGNVETAAFDDHAAVLGTLGVQALLLLLLAVLMPHLAFVIFWQVLFSPLGLVAEVAVSVFLFQGDESRELVRKVAVVSSRELFGVFLPMLLTVPPLFNFVYVFTYMLDSLNTFGIGAGGLAGLFGPLLALPFLPAMRRLPTKFLSYVVLVFGVLWVLLGVACFLVPTNTKHYCYFQLDC